jgi:hypothetical protein
MKLWREVMVALAVGYEQMSLLAVKHTFRINAIA